MKDQINDVKKSGMKPVLYIDSDLTRTHNEELAALVEGAEELGVPVIYSNDVSALNKLHKAYVFRYGHLSSVTETMVRKKNGVVVSGNLKIPAVH